MSSGRTAALPAALRIWRVISSRPALEIGCGVSESGSKKIGSSGPASRPNFSRNFRSCSWIARCASALSGTVFDLPCLRRLKYAICYDRLVYTLSDMVLVRRSHGTYLCCPSVLKRLLRYMQDRPLPCKFLFCNRLTPFHGGNTGSNPVGTPDSKRLIETGM